MSTSRHLHPTFDGLPVGDDFELTIPLVDGEEAALDLEGATARVAIFPSAYGRASGPAAVDRVADETGAGMVVIRLGRAETGVLEGGKIYYGEVEITTAGGGKHTAEPFYIIARSTFID